MSQEIGLVPKDENYVNPYKDETIEKVGQDSLKYYLWMSVNMNFYIYKIYQE